jgi:hypothetical protein
MSQLKGQHRFCARSSIAAGTLAKSYNARFAAVARCASRALKEHQ